MTVGLQHGAHAELPAQVQQQLVLVGGIDQHRVATGAAAHDEDIVVEGADHHLVDLHLGVAVMQRRPRVGRLPGDLELRPAVVVDACGVGVCGCVTHLDPSPAAGPLRRPSLLTLYNRSRHRPHGASPSRHAGSGATACIGACHVPLADGIYDQAEGYTMGLCIIREWGCSASRRVGRPSFRCSRPQGASRTWSTAATANARSRCRPFLVVACALIIAVLAASCGGDDTSDGDAPDSAETSDDDRTTADDEADSDDEADNEMVTEDDDETDATTSTVGEQQPAPYYESDVFANAYSAARDAYTSYSSARHDGYFTALGNVSSAVEEAGAARAAALAGAAAAFDDIESEARQVRRSVLNEIQSRRDAASAEDKSYLDRVNAILDAAYEEAEISGTESYYIWEKIGTGGRQHFPLEW